MKNKVQKQSRHHSHSAAKIAVSLGRATAARHPYSKALIHNEPHGGAQQ
jgi:hypothetical protein